MKVFIGKYPKNVNKERKINIQIDPWDTWNMDSTLALIITPMLKQLKEKNHGAPSVADEDVPEHVRKSAAPPPENEWGTDENYFKRWEWVMDEMIFAFESKHRDWEENFEIAGDYALEGRIAGDYDWEGRKACEDRITNGFRLFGKYYQGLWD